MKKDICFIFFRFNYKTFQNESHFYIFVFLERIYYPWFYFYEKIVRFEIFNAFNFIFFVNPLRVEFVSIISTRGSILTFINFFNVFNSGFT